MRSSEDRSPGSRGEGKPRNTLKRKRRTWIEPAFRALSVFCGFFPVPLYCALNRKNRLGPAMGFVIMHCPFTIEGVSVQALAPPRFVVDSRVNAERFVGQDNSRSLPWRVAMSIGWPSAEVSEARGSETIRGVFTKTQWN
jgi:hypothetical protein